MKKNKMKIKKLKIKLNKDNEYSEYRYFIPKSKNITLADGTDIDTAVDSLKARIAQLKEQASYLISKAPLVKYAEGSSITATGCADAPLKKFTIEGDSYQETREGYNKLPSTLLKTQNKNGVDFIVNDNKSLVLNGTSTSYTDIGLSGEWGENKPVVFTLKSGKTYKVQIGKDVNIQGYEGTTPKTTFYNSQIITPSSDINYTFLSVAVDTNKTFSNTLVEPMIYEYDGTEKPYEQYGVSPSLEYEAPVESVGDNVNLFNIETVTNQLVDLNTGVISSNSAWRLSEYIEVIPLNDYMFSWKSSHNFFQVRVHMYDENKTYLKTINNELHNIFAKTFATIENCKYIRVNYSVNVSGTEAIRENIKLEKGIKVTPYSPYGQSSVEIKQANKNFINIKDGSWTANGLTINVKDNIININGTVISSSNVFFMLQETLNLNGDYSFQSGNNIALTGGEYFRLYTGTTGFEVLKAFGALTVLNAKSENINISGSADRLAIRVNAGTVFNNVAFKPQLEKGSTATDYVVHQSQTKALYTQQPFRAIRDVKDRFVKIDDVWYEEHPIKRYVFNGKENWIKSSNAATTFAIVSFDNHISVSGGFSNCFPIVNTVWGKDIVGLELYENRNIRFCLGSSSEITTVELWKTKLTELYDAGTPVYVDYVLATPILIPCTVEQVEVLESLKTYKGTTYIDLNVIDILCSNMKIAYKQDLNLLIEEGI